MLLYFLVSEFSFPNFLDITLYGTRNNVSNNTVERTNRMMICCRNLSLGGGPEVCIKMVEQDVMTPLTTFVRQVCCTEHNE